MNARILAVAAAAVLTLPAACTGGNAAQSASNDAAEAQTIPVTIASASGTHRFEVEVAKTAAEQERGLMFRTDIPENGGMLFWPYPAGGGAPRASS